jgi:hypothetical protein
MVTGVPEGIDPVGEVTAETGGMVSVDLVAGTSPDLRVAGCVPMSANRLTVACFIRMSSGGPENSWLGSSPHDHWMVPAPNTSAPLGAL